MKKGAVVTSFLSIFVSLIGVENSTKEISISNKYDAKIDVLLRYYFDGSPTEFQQARKLLPFTNHTFKIDHKNFDCSKLTYMWLIIERGHRFGRQVLPCLIHNSNRFEVIPDSKKPRLFTIRPIQTKVLAKL